MICRQDKSDKSPCKKEKEKKKCKCPGAVLYFSGFFAQGTQGGIVTFYLTLGAGVTNQQRTVDPFPPADPIQNPPIILPIQFKPGSFVPVPNDIYFRVPRAGTLKNLRMSIEYSVGNEFVPPTGSNPPEPITVGIWAGEGNFDNNTLQFDPPQLTQTPLTVSFDLYDPRAIATKFVSSSNTRAKVPLKAGDYIAMVVQINDVISGEFSLKYVEASVEYV